MKCDKKLKKSYFLNKPNIRMDRGVNMTSFRSICFFG